MGLDRRHIGRDRKVHVAAALVILLAVALSIPGGGAAPGPGDRPSSHGIARTSVSGTSWSAVTLPDPGNWMETWVCTDRLSGLIVGGMIRVTEYLDLISRDVAAFLDRLDELFANGGLRDLEGLVSGVGDWVSGSMQELSCPSGDDDALPTVAGAPCVA